MDQFTYDNLKNQLLDTIEDFTSKNLESLNKCNHLQKDTKLEQLIMKLKYNKNLLLSNDKVIEEIIDDSFTKKNQYYHSGYISYLLCAWINHYNIEIGPWHLWNIFLWNIKEYNINYPDKLNKLWTLNKDKLDILFDDINIDISKIYKLLSKVIPVNIMDNIIIEFPNAPKYYLESIYGLICDISNNYYNFVVCSCNIENIRILGTIDEWNMLITNIIKIKADFEITNDIFIIKYINEIHNYLIDCIENLHNQDYWKDFFKTKNQKCIEGHITKLFINKIYLSKVPNIISKYSFMLENSSHTHNYISGVLSSYVDDDNFLIPKFNYILTKVNIPELSITPTDI